MEKNLRECITKVIQKHFNTKPKKLTRMKSGICNEVFLVQLGSREVIIRLNSDNDEMKGSEKYIPLFRSHGIKVPEILASDYSKKFIPYYYQIQSKLEGQDIKFVIDSLTPKELKLVAKEIATIFKKLLPLPTNGKFGFVYAQAKGLKKTFAADIRNRLTQPIQWGYSTGVLDAEMERSIKKLFAEHKSYFDSVKSKFYYDDMTSKNVLIYKGKFNGLVDLDGVAYGDHLETVGRIKASWYGTKYGEIYTNAVMGELKLTKKQRAMVTVYAILNRFCWMCENGIQFNSNTKAKVDWKKAMEDKKVITTMSEDLIK